MAHLAAAFAVARPAWGYPLDRQAMDDARMALAYAIDPYKREGTLL